MLRLIEDTFPEVYRFTTAVFPSKDDDVITSPYNSVLSVSELIEHADCVLPIENQALLEIVERVGPSISSASAHLPQSKKPNLSRAHLVQPNRAVQKQPAMLSSQIHLKQPLSSASRTIPSFVPVPRMGRPLISEQKSRAFDDMNTLGAHLLADVTCSIRFAGPLNVDLNEISMNLVPYPRLHFLIPSISPVSLAVHPLPSSTSAMMGSVNQAFSDAFNGRYQLIKANAKHSTFLACGLISRGAVQISDINHNINRFKPKIAMVPWNSDGFKIGLCSVPPLGSPYSVLLLANNSCIAETLGELKARFVKLYSRKAHLHHYTEHMDVGDIDHAASTLDDVILDYSVLGNSQVRLP